MEGLNETAAEGEARDEEEIEDQGPFSAETIRNETKGDLRQRGIRGTDWGKDDSAAYSAKGTEQQGEGDGRSLAEEESSARSHERLEKVYRQYHAWRGGTGSPIP